MSKNECALCQSLKTEQDHIIYQDDHVFVLVNIEPLKEGHVMILPVRHAEQLKDLTNEESGAFLRAIDLCMLCVTDAYQETPMCLVNGWKYRSQPHLHAHVLPSKHNLRGLYAAAEGLTERKRAEKEMLDGIVAKMKEWFGKLLV